MKSHNNNRINTKEKLLYFIRQGKSLESYYKLSPSTFNNEFSLILNDFVHLEPSMADAAFAWLEQGLSAIEPLRKLFCSRDIAREKKFLEILLASNNVNVYKFFFKHFIYPDTVLQEMKFAKNQLRYITLMKKYYPNHIFGALENFENLKLNSLKYLLDNLSYKKEAGDEKEYSEIIIPPGENELKIKFMMIASYAGDGIDDYYLRQLAPAFFALAILSNNIDLMVRIKKRYPGLELKHLVSKCDSSHVSIQTTKVFFKLAYPDVGLPHDSEEEDEKHVGDSRNDYIEKAEKQILYIKYDNVLAGSGHFELKKMVNTVGGDIRDLAILNNNMRYIKALRKYQVNKLYEGNLFGLFIENVVSLDTVKYILKDLKDMPREDGHIPYISRKTIFSNDAGYSQLFFPYENFESIFHSVLLLNKYILVMEFAVKNDLTFIFEPSRYMGRLYEMFESVGQFSKDASMRAEMPSLYYFAGLFSQHLEYLGDAEKYYLKAVIYPKNSVNNPVSESARENVVKANIKLGIFYQNKNDYAGAASCFLEAKRGALLKYFDFNKAILALPPMMSVSGQQQKISVLIKAILHNLDELKQKNIVLSREAKEVVSTLLARPEGQDVWTDRMIRRKKVLEFACEMYSLVQDEEEKSAISNLANPAAIFSKNKMAIKKYAELKEDLTKEQVDLKAKNKYDEKSWKEHERKALEHAHVEQVTRQKEYSLQMAKDNISHALLYIMRESMLNAEEDKIYSRYVFDFDNPIKSIIDLFKKFIEVDFVINRANAKFWVELILMLPGGLLSLITDAKRSFFIDFINNNIRLTPVQSDFIASTLAPPKQVSEVKAKEIPVPTPAEVKVVPLDDPDAPVRVQTIDDLNGLLRMIAMRLSAVFIPVKSQSMFSGSLLLNEFKLLNKLIEDLPDVEHPKIKKEVQRLLQFIAVDARDKKMIPASVAAICTAELNEMRKQIDQFSALPPSPKGKSIS